MAGAAPTIHLAWEERPVSPTSRVDYGLRALVALAATDSALKSEEIAAANAMPARYLERVLNDLRLAGLVRSKRGGTGGYWLARPAREITVADVMRALASPTNPNIRGGPLASVWATIETARMRTASRITVQALAARFGPSGPLPASGPHRLDVDAPPLEQPA